MTFEFGETAPRFSAAALNGKPDYCFDSAAGRPILMLFLGSGRSEGGAQALALLAKHHKLFDDQAASFFGVTTDSSDVAEQRIAQRIPGIRWFLDYDQQVSKLYGALTQADGRTDYLPHWLLLDSNLRLVRRARLQHGASTFLDLARFIAHGDEQTHAPVMMVPRIFEPELCRHLIKLYAEHGGSESGFMREEGGLTVGRLDPSFKRRSDFTIEDPQLRSALVERIRRRLAPEIERAFQFKATRIERWTVACYDAEQGGFFRPHRDNTAAGTAHRNFACTINLNAEHYEGGDLRFPEYGGRTYRAPTGGAVIFSCSLLHEALPVTRGKRYAFLPFLYDEAHALIRDQNRSLIVDAAALAPVSRPAVGLSAGAGEREAPPATLADVANRDEAESRSGKDRSASPRVGEAQAARSSASSGSRRRRA